MIIYRYLNKLFGIFKLLMIPLILFFMLSCSEILPTELDLDEVIFEEEISHLVGPGGINKTFTVYKISDNVILKIQSQGLAYLNNLQSSQEKLREIQDKNMNGPWYGPFADWHETPIIQEKKWLKYERPYNNSIKVLIENFFQDDAFTAKIPPSISKLFYKSIQSSKSFYSYGGYRGICILVVSPELKRAFYLFRD